MTKAKLEAAQQDLLARNRASGRNQQIADRYSVGETLQAIGDSLSISRQRVQQIVAKTLPNPDARDAAELALEKELRRPRARCHPDRKRLAKGLCSKCYMKKWWSERKQKLAA